MKDPIFQPRPETRVDDELAFHVEMHVRDLVARGIDPVEARRQAEATLGDRERLVDECKRIDHDIERSERRTQYLSELLQDGRFALRMLSRRRAFAAITIATLTIGIGAATAIYSIVDSVLLRPLPFSEPERVGALWITQGNMANNPTVAWLAETSPIGNDDYQAMKAGARAVSDIALYTNTSAFVDGPNGNEQIRGSMVTSSLFKTLRLRMALGRPFLPGDDALNTPPIALISWNAWQSNYNGDSSVIGKSLILDKKPHTIVGVLPRGLRLDRTQEASQYWVPALRDSSDIPSRHNRNYLGLVRLAPGATYEAASIELSRIMRDVTQDSTTGARVDQWQRDESRQSRGALLALLGAAIFLLGIACVNVAMLLLGESANRSREMAARAALGAGSGRLTRQLLVESLVIAGISALLGSALSWALMRGLVSLAPPTLPGLDQVALNLRVLAFAATIATATGLLFGLAPAFMTGRNAVAAAARLGVGQGNRKGAMLQRGLIATQLALSMVLLTDAFLLARSFRQLTSVDPGFKSENMTIARVLLPWEQFRDNEKARVAANAIQQRFAALPGVRKVVYSSAVPFAGGGQSSPVVVEGPNGPEPGKRGEHTQQRYVGNGFFEFMGIRLVRGRYFNSGDNASGNMVAIISEAEVKRDFKGREPLGVKVRHQGKWREIVGVVKDVKYRGLAEVDEATIYVPYDQNPNTYLTLIVEGPGQFGIDVFRRALREVEPSAAVTRVESLPRLVANSYVSERYRTVLIVAFALVASLLAAVGMYGVGSRTAVQRTREVGIRLALGSTDGAVARLMLRDAMRGVLIGLAVGIPATLALGKFIEPFLYGIKPTDVLSFVATALLLAAVTMLASYVPSRRASKADPAVVLRGE